MIRARVVAVLIAVVLGAGGGVTTAVVTADEDDQGPGTSTADPLGINYPMVNLPDCTGEAVLVIANGDGANPLTVAFSNLSAAEKKEARYLDTSKSCEARWVSENSTADPRWVAYLGPGNREDLCLARMSEEHQGDNVTYLIDGSDTRATCLCSVPAEAAPVLSPGMTAVGGVTIWIKALQNMFVTIDEGKAQPTSLTEDDITGVYDERTVARVREFGAASAQRADGVVDKNLWRRITDTGCKILG